jgi:hypothetical protein
VAINIIIEKQLNFLKVLSNQKRTAEKWQTAIDMQKGPHSATDEDLGILKDGVRISNPFSRYYNFVRQLTSI